MALPLSPLRSKKTLEVQNKRTDVNAESGHWLPLESMTASLIGHLGQARFLSFVRRIVFPGHASLRSLDWRSKGAAACMRRIGSGESRFPARFKLRSRHFRLHPHTSSGWTIPFRSGGGLLGHAWPPTFS